MDLTQFKLFSFDCYGTLVDWERGILDALAPICAEYGLAWGDDALLETFASAESAVEEETNRTGFTPYREVLARTLSKMGESLGFRPLGTTCERFAASVGDWPVFGDTVASLEILAKHGKLAILSNVDNDLFAATAEKLGVEFEYVFTAADIGSYKPDVRNFEHMLGAVDMPKSAILHIAQSLHHDVAPAKSLGLQTVWVNRRAGRTGAGATPNSDAVPDLEVPDMKSLADLLK